MLRLLRLELSGGLHHITLRGNRLEYIYLNDEDRIARLDIRVAVCKRFNRACHAWRQMTNMLECKTCLNARLDTPAVQ